MLIAGLRRTEPTSLEQLTQYISLHTSVKPRSTSLLPCPLSQESQLTYDLLANIFIYLPHQTHFFLHHVNPRCTQYLRSSNLLNSILTYSISCLQYLHDYLLTCSFVHVWTVNWVLRYESQSCKMSWIYPCKNISDTDDDKAAADDKIIWAQAKASSPGKYFVRFFWGFFITFLRSKPTSLLMMR